MIHYIEHKNIDKKKWDHCINNASNASVFVYSWYLDIVCKHWCALILNDYEAVFPIAPQSKYSIHVIYQPFFTRYFGAYSRTKISTDVLNDFVAAIPNKFKSIDICLHENSTFKKTNFKIHERKFQYLSLAEKYDSLQKEFSENTKRNVKKAIKNNLRVSSEIAPEKIVTLFRTTKGGELTVFKPKDYAILIDLMNMCVKKNKGKSMAVYDGEELCAAAFFMFDNNRFTFLKSGVTELGKVKGAMHLLFDSFIKENSGKACLLDFGGSSVDSVARFYKQFGAKDCVYLRIKKNNLPTLVKWIKSLKS